MIRRLLGALLLLAASAHAGKDPPFPYPERTLTLGEFLRAVSGSDGLDLNFVVKESVPRQKRLALRFRGMSCREALDLVVQLEDLQVTEFRPGLYLIARASERIGGQTLVERRYQLTYTTAEKVIAAIKANPRLAARVDPAHLSAGTDPKTLIALVPEAVVPDLTRAIAGYDGPTNRTPAVIPISFLSREDLDAALAAMGTDATGGLTARDVVYLPHRRSIAVAGTPEQVEKLGRLIALLDIAPEAVQIGVTSASAGFSKTRRLGFDTAQNGPAIVLPGRIPPLGGTVAYDVANTSSSSSGTLWISTLSGSPARIGIEQIFAIPRITATVAPGGQVTTGQGVNEVPVGLALEVLPRVQGRAVLVEVRLVDSSPTRVTDVGVDRTEQNLVTKVLLPRGGSTLIGGFAQAMATRERPGVLPLLDAARRSGQDLAVILSVR